MPATITTREPLEDTSDEVVQRLIALRIKAGAIRSRRAGNELLTEWNVVGENDEPDDATDT